MRNPPCKFMYFILACSMVVFLITHLKLLFSQPGEEQLITLVSIGGGRVIRGGNNIVDGSVDVNQFTEVIESLNARDFPMVPEMDV